MEIEFFHSVLCGHCFIMSSRLRKVVEKYPEWTIIHRNFPLRWDDTNDNNHFETEQEQQRDFERKWKIANKIDDQHRFHVEGLKNMNFSMPTSRLPMIAIQAATLAGGDEWDLFDRFQSALYEEVKNISDEEVIADLIIDAGVDFTEFLKYYEDPKNEALIKEDFKRAKAYELDHVPAMVVEGKHKIVGTKRLDLAINLVKEAAEAEGLSL